jgi:hypothetical protein
MATTTEASAKTAPMMLTTMVIESVLSGEAELIGATGLTPAGVAVPKSWVVERDMLDMMCSIMILGCTLKCNEDKIERGVVRPVAIPTLLTMDVSVESMAEAHEYLSSPAFACRTSRGAPRREEHRSTAVFRVCVHHLSSGGAS